MRDGMPSKSSTTVPTKLLALRKIYFQSSTPMCFKRTVSSYLLNKYFTYWCVYGHTGVCTCAHTCTYMHMLMQNNPQWPWHMTYWSSINNHVLLMLYNLSYGNLLKITPASMDKVISVLLLCRRSPECLEKTKQSKLLISNHLIVCQQLGSIPGRTEVKTEHLPLNQLDSHTVGDCCTTVQMRKVNGIGYWRKPVTGQLFTIHLISPGCSQDMWIQIYTEQ